MANNKKLPPASRAWCAFMPCSWGSANAPPQALCWRPHPRAEVAAPIVTFISQRPSTPA